MIHIGIGGEVLSTAFLADMLRPSTAELGQQKKRGDQHRYPPPCSR